MAQGSVAASTGIRRVLRAVRPLALLGGFVVMWWLLATGAAQADAGPQPDADVTKPVLVKAVERTVREPVQRATDRVRTPSPTPAKLVKAVRQHAAPAVSTTRSIVRSTPVEPVVATVSETVRSQVTKVAKSTRAVLRSTPVGGSVVPDIEVPTDMVDAPPALEESSIQEGETRSSAASGTHFEPGALVGAASPASSLDAAPARALPGQAKAAPGTRSGGGSEAPALRSSGATAVSTAQPGSGTAAGAGLLETGLDIMLLATKTSLSSLADWQPAGPAYPPAPTPD